MMKRSVSARWKRRVGRLHWETDDEFIQFSSYSPALLDTLAVVVTAAAPDGTNFMWGRGLIMICGMVSVVLLVGRRLHGKKGTPTRRVSPARAFPWERRHGRATKRKKKDRRETKTSILSIKKRKKCDRGDPVAAVKQLHSTGAASVKKLNSETCSGNESDERPVQVTSMSTDTSLPKANADNDNDVVELVRLAVPPVLVADRSEATATTCMTVSPFCNSSTLGLTLLDDESTNKAFLFTDCTASMVSRRSIVAAAEDATALAQKIRVTQAIFSNHGLDPNLASEWAMRRQESDSSEASRRKLEDRRFVMDTIQRHEDRQVSERQFREMRASIEYDNDWLEKIHRAREKCLYACLYSLFLSMLVSLLVETYWNVPEDASAVSFLTSTLGCDCESSDVNQQSDSSLWSMAWFSEYCTGALYSWTRESLSHPLCYIKCIGWRLLPPLGIQIGLHFCRCPKIIHQAVTIVTIVSLLSPQLAIIVSEFMWCRLLPLLVVTFASVARVWTFTSSTVDSLQRSQDDLRKILEEALISFDSLHSNVFLAHFCMIGLLLAMSPKLIS